MHDLGAGLSQTQSTSRTGSGGHAAGRPLLPHPPPAVAYPWVMTWTIVNCDQTPPVVGRNDYVINGGDNYVFGPYSTSSGSAPAWQDYLSGWGGPVAVTEVESPPDK